MTLDLSRVSPQIRVMGEDLQASAPDRQARLDRARAFFSAVAPQWEELAAMAKSSQRAGAAPLGPLDARHSLPAVPPSYEVLATDGSTIEPDRHGIALCALINIGWARICYGAEPRAEAGTNPRLIFRPEDLYVEQNGRRVLLRDRLLDAQRSVAEMSALSDLAEIALGGPTPRVALADGLLTVWREDWAQSDNDAITTEFAAALDRIHALNLPLAAYVSAPASHWVLDILRNQAGCGQLSKGCLLHCDPSACDLKGLLDVDLFRFLDAGERSTTLEVVGAGSQRYGDENGTHFFYVNVSRELARVEVPAWVARDETACRTVHAILVDQASRGFGYPVVLARAHENAVISGGDRRAFQQLVAEMLTREGFSAGLSEKQTSKNLRAV